MILPLARPGLVAVALFTFLIAWNSYVWALVLTTDSSMFVLSVGIANMVGEYRVQWNELMAAAVIAALPVDGALLAARAAPRQRDHRGGGQGLSTISTRLFRLPSFLIFTTRIAPISPMLRTCVPPHGWRSISGMRRRRTRPLPRGG